MFFSIIVDENFAYSWILDSRYSFHTCPYEEWFDTYRECDISTIWIGNDSSSKVFIGIP